MEDAQGLHRRAWDLIPWVVNGSASEVESRLVAQHVAVCPDCRDELVFHRQLQAGMVAPAVEPHSAEPALARLWAQMDRVEDEASEAPPAVSFAAAPRRRWTRWLAVAVVVQAVTLGTLGGVLWGRDHDPRAANFQTLSQPQPAAGVATIRLVPAPDLQLGELRALLERNGVQITQSNGDGAILGLDARRGSRVPLSEVLTRLRAEPGVLLVEPIQTDAAVRP